MKPYPSIRQGVKRPFSAHVFDKIDGSNLYFAWSRKRGWHEYGTRQRTITAPHPVFDTARQIFDDLLATRIAKTATDQGWTRLEAFVEFWGPNSFAGRHVDTDAKQLSLLDVRPYKRGFVGPERMRDLFRDLPMPAYLGVFEWNEEFVERVRRGELDGVTCEGVVGKAGDGHKVTMAKAKTQVWLDEVVRRHGAGDERL